MESSIIDFIEKFGYLGVTLLIAVENIFPPIPSEVILTFGGFMTTCSEMNFIPVVIFATIGSLIGALALYALGAAWNVNRLERFAEGRVGRLLRLKKNDITRAAAWFERSGKSTVFFCRFIPIVRSLISIPAGTAGMNLPLFLIYTTAGSAIWNTVLIALGRVFGAAFSEAAGYFGVYSLLTAVALSAVAIIGVTVYIRRRLTSNM